MTAREAPIPRTLIDELAPWLRAILGIMFIAYSANSTIFRGADDLMWLFESTAQITIGAFADAYWYSSLFALVLFVGEVVCSERYKRSYWIFLVPDAFYTSRGMWAGLTKAMGLLIGGMIGDGATAVILGIIVGTIIAAVAGYYIAKWGEVLLFGKRRQIRGAVIKKE